MAVKLELGPGPGGLAVGLVTGDVDASTSLALSPAGQGHAVPRRAAHRGRPQGSEPGLARGDPVERRHRGARSQGGARQAGADRFAGAHQEAGGCADPLGSPGGRIEQGPRGAPAAGRGHRSHQRPPSRPAPEYKITIEKVALEGLRHLHRRVDLLAADRAQDRRPDPAGERRDLARGAADAARPGDGAAGRRQVRREGAGGDRPGGRDPGPDDARRADRAVSRLLPVPGELLRALQRGDPEPGPDRQRQAHRALPGQCLGDRPGGEGAGRQGRAAEAAAPRDQRHRFRVAHLRAGGPHPAQAAGGRGRPRGGRDHQRAEALHPRAQAGRAPRARRRPPRRPRSRRRPGRPRSRTGRSRRWSSSSRRS